MLSIKNGNLFEHLENKCYILHGCNAQGVMGTGFAKEIRKQYPDAWKVYSLEHSLNGLVLGSYTIGKCNNHYIVNLITQIHYGNNKSVVYVSYNALKEGIESFLTNDYNGSMLPIHLPLIGGGLANGNKNVLINIFEECFKHVNATLWLPPT